jgi:ribosomal protein S18 acetylase RimI-like enzyme
MSDLDLLPAVEAAAVRGWPALETEAHQGWLFRYASGGSVRANTVAALAFTGRDVDAAISAAERFYRAHNAPCAFTVSEVSSPADLDERLAARGYVRGDDHVTMAKTVDLDATLPCDIAVGLQPTNGWMEAYVSGLSVNRRDAAPALIANLPMDKAVFLSRDLDHRAIASGLTIVDGPLASVQCMATLPAHRGRGAARAVLDGIEAIAVQNACEHLYLQTGGDNHTAQRLYVRAGFRVIGRYHTRTR